MSSPNLVHHISIGTNQFEKAVAFYDRVLATLGCKRIADYPGAVSYGRTHSEIWVQTPFNEKKAASANGVHIGFFAASKNEVDQFYKAAMEMGGKDDGPPGPRPMYGEPYYGCFVHDIDGHKIEAMFWDTSISG